MSADPIVIADKINVTLQDFTLNCAAPNAIQVSRVSKLTLRNITIPDFNVLAIALDGVADYVIEDCHISRSKPAETQNQAINISSASRPSVRGRIVGNTLVNSALFMDAADTLVTQNEVSGWQFGSGLTTASAATTARNVFTFNKIHDATGLDVNNTIPAGIENWGPNSFIAFNDIHDIDGSGIVDGGPGSVISGNNIFRVGRVKGVPVINPFRQSSWIEQLLARLRLP